MHRSQQGAPSEKMSGPSEEEKGPPAVDQAFSPELDAFYAKTMGACSKMKGQIEEERHKKDEVRQRLVSEFGEAFYSERIVPMLEEHKRTGGELAVEDGSLPPPMEK